MKFLNKFVKFFTLILLIFSITSCKERTSEDIEEPFEDAVHYSKIKYLGLANTILDPYRSKKIKAEYSAFLIHFFF